MKKYYTSLATSPMGQAVHRFGAMLRAGLDEVKRSEGKRLALGVIAAYMLAEWLVLGWHNSRLAVLAFPLFMIAGAALLSLVVVAMSHPLERLKAYHRFQQIGFKNAAGEYPFLCAYIQKSGALYFAFETIGIPLEKWLEKQPELQSAFNIFILDMLEAEDKQHISWLAVPAQGALPALTLWSDDYMLQGDFPLALGFWAGGLEKIDLAKIPHALIAGTPGSGKSVLLRCIMRQLVKKGAGVYLIDYKLGVDFADFQNEVTLLTDEGSTLQALMVLLDEMKRRHQSLVDEGVANISEYNKKYRHGHMTRKVIVIDEASLVFDMTGLSGDDKKMVAQITRAVIDLARLGRATGVHVIVCTQRTSVDSVPGALKALLECKIAGRCADDASSIAILGHGKATDLPKIPGRFMTGDGHEFQAFYYDSDICEKEGDPK